MKTKEISYRRVFSLGDFQTETYSVTVELQDSADVQEAIELARREIEEAHSRVMSERAKPERVEKASNKTRLTKENYNTVVKAIKAGKASREYIDENFIFSDDVRKDLDDIFKQLNK